MDEVSVRSVRVFLLVGKRVRKSEIGRGERRAGKETSGENPFQKMILIKIHVNVA